MDENKDQSIEKKNDEFPIKRDRTLNKLLFSSPMKFCGMFENSSFYIHHAFPGFANEALRIQQTIRNSTTRYFYVLLFQGEPYTELGKTKMVNDYNYFAKEIIASLAVFFGKQFEVHGLIERAGMFEMSDMTHSIALRNISLAPFNETARANASVELNFTKCQPILRLYNENLPIDKKLLNLFRLSARLYLRSLQAYHVDIESAYMDLVACGEVIAGYFNDYSDTQKYDDSLRGILTRLEAANIDSNDINRIKSMIYAVKKKFILGIKRLLNDSYYMKTDIYQSHGSIGRENIADLIGRTYDLRSDHTHNGTHIAFYLDSWESSEICNTGSGNAAKDRRYSGQCFSYAGLERLIRFCLLSILQRGGLDIHPDLQSIDGLTEQSSNTLPNNGVAIELKSNIVQNKKRRKSVEKDTHDRAVAALIEYVQRQGITTSYSLINQAQADPTKTRWQGSHLLLFDQKKSMLARLKDGLHVERCPPLEELRRLERQAALAANSLEPQVKPEKNE